IVFSWLPWRAWPRLPRLAAWTVVGLLLAGEALLPLARCRDKWAVTVGWESRARWLERHEPTYLAAATAQQEFPGQSHLLSQEHRAFYFPGRVTRENLYRRRTHYDRSLSAPDALSGNLRAAGFTHLLLAESLQQGGVDFDPTLSRLAEAE